MPENLLRIVPVLSSDRAEALRLVFCRMAEPDRQQQIDTFLAAAATNPDALAGLLGAYRAEKLGGALLIQTQPGKTASLWPPQLADGELPSTACSLLESADTRFRQKGVRLVQSLLETDAQPEADLLRKGGFRHAADLLYLACLKDQFPTAQPATSLQFELYADAHHDRFARLVDATYVDTLDCPDLNGVRDIEDVLTDYRITGVFDPARWLIVRQAGADVGCLILTEHASYDTWELIYMGIVPSARGQGLGAKIARRAQWLAGRAGRSRLVLAVDAKNDPAIRMYAAVGFQAWDRRSVFLKIFDGA
jgi:mycothiol synthase